MNTQIIIAACEQAGGQAALARQIGASPAFVYQWATGRRHIPAEFCPKIERATHGRTRCEDLRPDVEWDVLRRCGCRDEAAHDERGSSEHEFQEAA